MDDVKAPKMFHEFLGITASIETGSAGTEGEEINIRELVGHFFKASKGNFVGHETTTKTKGSTNCFRLFITLFQSPMRKRSWAQLNLLVRRHLHPSQIQRRAISMQDTDFPILHTDEILCVSIEGRCFGSNEGTIGSNSNNERRSIPGDDKLIRTIGAHDAKSPRTITPGKSLFRRLLHRRTSIIFITFTNQLDNHFCIRLTIENMTSRLKLFTEFIGIVERTVMNEGDFSRGVGVRVGIGIGLASVGSPASMSDANVVAIVDTGALVNEVETIGLFALGCKFRHHHRRIILIHGSNSSAVISTILQNGKSLDQIIPSIALGTHYSSNATALGIALLVHGSGSGERCSSGSKKTEPGR
mmetsp:Transcript_43943/g.78878  ORF Transcript_43943/g.78878 Transcript_43943/m.78878 type:complete len:358 (-) Transcript_43943:420-1493(-)